MKQYLFILLGFVLYGCYEDNGNYEYDPGLEIEIKGIQSSYRLMSYSDTLRISPQIDKENCEYHWVMYWHKTGQSRAMDTISNERNLVYPIELDPLDYSLILHVADKETGITEFFKTTLNVATPFMSGWYLLKSINGMTDYDHYTDSIRLNNFFLSTNGKQVKGEAVGMGYSAMLYMQIPDSEDKTYYHTRVLFTLTTEDLAVSRLENGKIERHYEDMFYYPPEVKKLQTFIDGGQNLFLLNNGRLHSITVMQKNTGKFGEPKTNIDGLGDYNLLPFTSGSRNFLWFNDDTKSFNYSTIFGEQLYAFADTNMTDLNADLLYLGMKGNRAYSILKDLDSDTCRLHYCASEVGEKTKGTIRPIDFNVNLGQADRWAMNKEFDVMYYSVNNAIYRCDIAGEFVETEMVKFESDYNQITFLEHIQHRKGFEGGFEKLAIAVTNGTNYRVYLYDIVAGSIAGEPKVIEGEGVIKDMLYL